MSVAAEPGALMGAEMSEQPEVLARLLERRAELRRETLAAVGSDGAAHLRGIVLLARGSSDNAAVYARYLCELYLGLPTSLAAPSVWSRYGARVSLDGWLAVGLSQSGRTPEITDVLDAMAAAGAATLAVTNDASSPLASVARGVILLGAGEEQAVPATKTFTAQLAAVALLIEALGQAPWQASTWDRVVTAMRGVLDDVDAVGPIAASAAAADRRAIVGRGLHYAVALEGALKLSETTGLAAAGYAALDLRHGPIAAAGPGTLAIGLAAEDPTCDDVLDVLERVRARGAQTALVRALPSDGDQLRVSLPAGLHPGLLPLVTVVRLQQLARAAALLLGLDPDRPEGLTKVTATT